MSEVFGELTVRGLRWIVNHCDGELTIPEAIAAFAGAERRAEDDAAHAQLQRAYFEYLERRRERGSEQVQRAAAAAQEEAIRSRPISREDALMVSKEAAHLERLRFDEIFERRLTFEEWMEAGQPAVHRTGDAPRGLRAKLGGATNG